MHRAVHPRRRHSRCGCPSHHICATRAHQLRFFCLVLCFEKIGNRDNCWTVPYCIARRCLTDSLIRGRIAARLFPEKKVPDSLIFYKYDAIHSDAATWSVLHIHSHKLCAGSSSIPCASQPRTCCMAHCLHHDLQASALHCTALYCTARARLLHHPFPPWRTPRRLEHVARLACSPSPPPI